MKKLSEYPLEHVGFIVEDLEDAMNQFTDLLGIEQFRICFLEPSHARSYGKEILHYQLKVAVAELPGDHVGIELIQPFGEEGVHSEFIQSGRRGLHHIAFAVEDYDECKSYFSEMGVNIVFECETDNDAIGYWRCFNVNDEMIGTVFEFLDKSQVRSHSQRTIMR